MAEHQVGGHRSALARQVQAKRADTRAAAACEERAAIGAQLDTRGIAPVAHRRWPWRRYGAAGSPERDPHLRGTVTKVARDGSGAHDQPLADARVELTLRAVVQVKGCAQATVRVE